MSADKLNQSLEKLRAEIKRLEEENRHIRQTLSRLIEDVEHHLEHPEDAGRKTTLIENLKNHIKQYEAAHPALTGVLNQIMITLSGMGI